LKGHNVAIGVEAFPEQLGRGRRVVAFHRDGRPGQRRGQVAGQHGPRLHGEVLHGPGDGQAALVDRGHVGRVGVAEQDVVAVPDQMSADRAADSTRTDNRQLQPELLVSPPTWEGTRAAIAPNGEEAQVNRWLLHDVRVLDEPESFTDSAPTPATR
jgi:hypothetical protein